MDASYLNQVELIAKAAEDVPLSAQGAIAHFAQTMRPRDALLMVGEIRQLRAALKEALDGWDALVDEAHNEHATRDSPDPCATERARIAELRKLVGE